MLGHGLLPNNASQDSQSGRGSRWIGKLEELTKELVTMSYEGEAKVLIQGVKPNWETQTKSGVWINRQEWTCSGSIQAEGSVRKILV